MVRAILGFAALASMAAVALGDISYNVVGYPTAPTNVFGVSINGVVTKLTANENTFPLFNGTVPGTTADTVYSYVEISAAGAVVRSENFTRTLHAPDAKSTYNEFFQRQITKYDMPRLPYSYLVSYPSKTGLFNDDEIATLHLSGTVTEVAAINAAPTAELSTKVSVRYIDHNTVYSQTNITFQTAGKSSKDYAKQAFKLNFDTAFGQSFFSRPNIKLRPEATEPTLMRERLYIDLLNSAGVPTSQGGYVRLFINQEFYGLYLMVDDIKSSFVKQTIYGGDATKTIGSLVQGNAFLTQADLIYKGPTTASYDKDTYVVQNVGNNPVTDPLAQLIVFMQDLQNFDPATNTDPVGYFNNTRFELDGFLRIMAIEYLTAAFDNYWMQGSNYFMYYDPYLGSSGKWRMVPTDFDGTFGSGTSTDPKGSYKTLANLATNDHPLVSKLILNNTVINKLFVDTLTNIVQYAFKPEAMFPRIDMLAKMLYDDVALGYTTPLHSAGTDAKYTIADFSAGVSNGTSGTNGSPGLKAWITDRSTAVTQELGFSLIAGTPDRVTPPPRKTPKGDGGQGDGSAASAGLKASMGLAVLAIVGSLLAMA